MLTALAPTSLPELWNLECKKNPDQIWFRFSREREPDRSGVVKTAAEAALNPSAAAAGEPCDQRDNEHHEENEEQEFRDPGRCYRYTTESKDSGNDRDNQKYQRPIKHGASYGLVISMTSICDKNSQCLAV